MTSISPAVSLQSCESNLSSCSDFSVEANSDRSDRHQENGYHRSMQHFNGFQQSSNVMKRDQDMTDGDDNSTCLDRDSVPGQSHESGDTNLDQIDSSLNDDESGTSVGVDEMNGRFWEPPEPDDYEDDVEGRVSDYDDDDADCGDGTVWAKPTSLSDFGEEKTESSKFKVEKQKAMDELMSGKFKSLVGQLLKSAGVLSSEKDGNGWIDVITSLSWEAAKFVRPGFTDGKAMDPDGYVKIKCIATGSPQESRVVKGLVFKKHAAHKHMPTKYKNPRLLLIEGALGLSTSGLSSFESMQQEKDSLKAISDVLDNFQPNVVLVEKTVARDIQESILAKGVTLVLDMKLHRLERISRCTGSPILSSDRLIGQKLWLCDSFHIEKFVEEHASGEGGKRPRKTLMFLEGCPTRLGCTILLMGADSDQLKKIKCALRCAVVMAYHFILETYFLLDLKTMFSTMPVSQALNLTLNNQDVMSVAERHTSSSNGECSAADSSVTCTTDIPISDGLNEESLQLLNPDWEANSSFSFGPYNPIFLSGLSSLSSSLKRVMSDSFPLLSTPYPAMSVYFGVDEKQSDQEANSDIQIPISSQEVINDDSELILNADEDEINKSPSKPLSAGDDELLDTDQGAGDPEDDLVDKKDDIKAVLDSESILVLMSSRNASRMTLCEHSHFSHIKFYRNFDIPLGKYLRENLLNQKLRCKTCSESPEAHFYYHAHHNKQLTIQVRRLPGDKSLPGESEGKLWMWSRCGKCKSPTTSKISTRRVLISKAARGLSFGKFLELCFSNPSTFGTKSNCGHSLHKDFLYFFGLGTMVAMFKYSTVTTYSVGLSPAKLDFGNSMNGTLLKSEFEKVYMAGISMFLKLENILEELRPRFLGLTLNLPGSVKDFSYVEDLLKQEKSQFEVDIQNPSKDENGDTAILKLVRLNRLRLELFLEAYNWDRRLRCLSKPQVVENREPSLHNDADSKDIPIENGETLDISVENGETLDISVENGEKVPSDSQTVEFDLASSDEKTTEIHISEVSAGEKGVENGSITYAAASENSSQDNVAENLPPFVREQSDKVYPVNTDSECSTLELNSVKSQKKSSFNLENENDWVWTPFFEIRREYVKDIWRGNLPRFESLPSLYLDSTAQEAIINEGSRLHIPLGTDDYIVSDFEDEFSSIIACALALLKDVPCANQEADNSQSLPRVMSISSPIWSSNSSLDSEGSFASSISSEDSHYSSFDGLDFLDSLAPSVHPEVSMGIGKSSGKRKYSVVCIYASQFRQLRNRCAYESGYIASLSRCRNWNAKGGKSNSVFCKTLDERFIIKEVQKTEFESFMKFAPNYFDYMNECHVLGNQTCLAKILGMYQVFIKSSKTGKESRHNLMVMENLSFGRSIARQYDLKGALHARFVSTGNGAEDVLLDQNFVNDMNVSPLYVSRTSKRNLQRAVWNDCTFLNSINVMDYSLLVGVDETKHELVCGIIDYLRQYTWDKQLETWAKISFVGRKNHQPTIISPIEYKKRFRKFIDTHFLSVPEDWCSHRSSNPCRLCGKRENDDDEEDSSLSSSQEQAHVDNNGPNNQGLKG